MKSKLTLPHLLCLVLLLAFSNRHFAQISIPNGTFTNSENFSTLANTGTSSVVPTGWAFFETGTNANTLYTAGTGSSNTGDTYSLGLAANTERAFGGLQSGTLTPTVGVCYTNNTGSTITGLTVTYLAGWHGKQARWNPVSVQPEHYCHQWRRHLDLVFGAGLFQPRLCLRTPKRLHDTLRPHQLPDFRPEHPRWHYFLLSLEQLRCHWRR
jgi:hypothetical protein